MLTRYRFDRFEHEYSVVPAIQSGYSGRTVYEQNLWVKVRPVYRSKWCTELPGSRSESLAAAPYLPPTRDFLGNPIGASPYVQVMAPFTGLQTNPPGLPLAPGAPVTGQLEHANLRAGSSNASSLQPGKSPERSKSEETVTAAPRDTQLPQEAPNLADEGCGPEIEDAQSKVPAVEALVEMEKATPDPPTTPKAVVSLPAPPSDPGKPGEGAQADVAAPSNEDETEKADSPHVQKGEEVDLPKEKKPDTTPGVQAQQLESTSQPNAAGPSKSGGKGARTGKGGQKGKGPAKSQPSDLDQVTQLDKSPKPAPATSAAKEKISAANKGNRSSKFTNDQIQDRKRDSLRIPTPLDFSKSKERTGVTGMSYAQKAAAALTTPTTEKTPGLGPSAASSVEPALQSPVSAKEAEDSSADENIEGERDTETQAPASDALKPGGTTQLTAQPVVQDASQKDGDLTATNLGVAQEEGRHKTDTEAIKA